MSDKCDYKIHLLLSQSIPLIFNPIALFSSMERVHNDAKASRIGGDRVLGRQTQYIFGARIMPFHFQSIALPFNFRPLKLYIIAHRCDDGNRVKIFMGTKVTI
jgi:hypothetical protein